MSDAPGERRRTTVAAALQRWVLCLLVVWTLVVHTVLVDVTGTSAWRLGGFGMYGQPGADYVAVSVVSCSSPSSCRIARRAEKAAIARGRGGKRVSVFAAARSGGSGGGPAAIDIRYVMEAPGAVSRRWSAALKLFETFPKTASARRLVELIEREACPRRCVVFHLRQRVSVVRRTKTVESRPFDVVRAPSAEPTTMRADRS